MSTMRAINICLCILAIGFVLLTLASLDADADTTWSNGVVDSFPDLDTVEQVDYADIDNDGDLDLICSDSGVDRVVWYENLGTSFSTTQKIIRSETDPTNFKMVDMDRDGWVDIVMQTETPNYNLFWSRNTGSPNYLTNVGRYPTIVPNFTGDTFDVGDVDRDGDIDLMYTAETGAVLLNNSGNSISFNFHVLAGLTYGGYGRLHDVDGDGDLDAVLFSSSATQWLENDGSNSGWSMHATGTYFPDDVVDLDRDGDLDFLHASGGIVAYFLNNGDGSFGSVQNIEVSSEQGRACRAADLDCDGDLDVLTTQFVTGGNLGWYENLGGLAFSARKAIQSSYVSYEAEVCDLDNDGDIDIVTAGAGAFSDELGVHRNTGDFTLDNRNWAGMDIDSGLSIPKASTYGDLDGDGDLDVITSTYADNTFAWYENTDGAGGYGSRQVISSSVLGASCAIPMDVDGDGDLDVMTASSMDNTIGYYRNYDGQGSFGSRQVMSSSASGVVRLDVGDIDRDGDLDVVSASVNNNEIAWYENTDGNGTFSYHLVSSSHNQPRDVRLADLDKDADLDILAVSFFDSKLVWYENNGSGGFLPQVVISTSAQWPLCVRAGDVDSDGDLDVLVTGEFNGIVAWFENTDGACTFGGMNTLALDGPTPRSAAFGDIDRDGDLDIIAVGSNDGSTYWFQNLDGDGTFGPKNMVQGSPSGASYIELADLNKDAVLDALITGENGGVVWCNLTDVFVRNTNTNGWYNTFDQAIAAASPGHTLYVRNITLNGDLNASKWITIEDCLFGITGDLLVAGDSALYLNNITLECGGMFLDGNLTVTDSPDSITCHDIHINNLFYLDNSCVKLACQSNGQYNVEALGTATVIIEHNSAVFASSNNFAFTVAPGATFRLCNSSISNCGWDDPNPGLLIEANDAYIYNSSFGGCYNGITLKGCSNAMILDSVIGMNANAAIMLQSCDGCTISGNDLSLNDYGVVLDEVETFDNFYTPGYVCGLEEYSYFGHKVRGGFDVNNDGFDDAIVGDYANTANGADSGMVRVYSGLDGSVLYTFYGDDASDYTGYGISGFPDVNGDNCDEFLIGSPHNEDLMSGQSGSVTLYSGINGVPIQTFYGHRGSYGWFGVDVADAGDVNNDSIHDIVVGAYTYNSNTGYVRVISGSDYSQLWQWDGEKTSGKFGFSVDAAGDVDNDGFDDIIIGAPEYSTTGVQREGKVYVYSGQTGGLLHTWTGQYENFKGDSLGWTVSSAGDMNGDGYDDIVFGAQRKNFNGTDSGVVYVYSGKDWSSLYTIPGRLAYSRFGYSVSEAGDLNKDGYDDIIAGCGWADYDYVLAISGKDGSTLDYIENPDATDRGKFGYSVAYGGDVDNDGWLDIAIGALMFPNGTLTNMGASFPYLGTQAYDGSSGNLITGNLFSDVLTIGVDISANSVNNQIIHNTFKSNALHAQDLGANDWDLGPTVGGNYWDDWVSPDDNLDGYVDNPRPIAGGAMQDNYPFTLENGWYKVYNVDKDKWYDNLTNALSDADDYDTLELNPGTYSEDIYISNQYIRIADSNFKLDGNLELQGGDAYLCLDNISMEVLGPTYIDQWARLDIINSPNTIITKNTWIEGYVYLNSSSWEVNCSYDGQYGIFVNSSGYLEVNNTGSGPSVIRALDPLYHYELLVNDNGELNVQNSSIQDAGWDWDHPGVFVNSGDAYLWNASFYDCFIGLTLNDTNSVYMNWGNISGSDQYGIWMRNTTYSYIENVTCFGNGNTGLYMENGNDDEIENCTLWNNSGSGMRLTFSGNIHMYGNFAHNNTLYGIHLFDSRGTFRWCMANDNGFDGFLIQNVGKTWFDNITALNNNRYGVHFLQSNMNYIEHVSARYNQDGIYSSGSETQIHNSTICYNYNAGIKVFNSSFTRIVRNWIYYNNRAGIELNDTDNVTLAKNELWENNQAFNWNCAGLLLLSSDHNNISSNQIHHNLINGVKINDSHNNEAWNNTINYNYAATSNLRMEDSHNNHFQSNELNWSTGIGLSMYGCDFNEFINCSIGWNNGEEDFAGIYAYDCWYNNFERCNISENGAKGLYMDSGGWNTIYMCNITYNSGTGIELYNESMDTIYLNKLKYNEESIGGETGIHITMSHDITINENNVSRNYGAGIYFDDCYDCDVYDNNVSWNDEAGIWMSSCENIEVYWNHVYENYQNHYSDMGGIQGYDCFNLTIWENHVHDNPMYGMYMQYVSNSIIGFNNISRNYDEEAGGIFLADVYDSVFQNNNVSNSTGTGIEMYSCGWNEFYNNTVNGNNMASSGNGGLYMSSCLNNTWFNNTFNNNSGYGAYLSECAFNDFFENFINNNTDDGVYMDTSYENTFILNWIMGNNQDGFIHTGFHMEYCHNNTLTFNIIRNNSGTGLYLYSSHWNDIIGNNITNNTGEGIYMEDSNNNTIHDNDVIGNDYGGNQENTGIYLSWSSWTTITDNNILFNQGTGLVMDECQWCDVRGNLIHRNIYSGIEIYYGGNHTLFNNSIFRNNVGWSEAAGIYMSDSWNNVFFNNSIIKNIEVGVYIMNCNNIEFHFNNITNNTGNGLDAQNSNFNTFINNTFDGNNVYEYWDGGVSYGYSHNCTWVNNTFNYNNYTGLELLQCIGMDFIGNEIINNTGRGIDVFSCDWLVFESNNITGNDWEWGGGTGMHVDTSNNISLYNNVFDSNYGDGVYIVDSWGCEFDGNLIQRNTQDGIDIWNSKYCYLTNNNISRNNYSDWDTAGINLYNIDNFFIAGNNISRNRGMGLRIESSSHNITILLNKITNNTGTGVKIQDLEHSDILSNIIYNNSWDSFMGDTGLSIRDSNNLTILDNAVKNNSGHGMSVTNAPFISIIDNNVSYNANAGMFLDHVWRSNINDNWIVGNDVESGHTTGIMARFCRNSSFSGNNVSWNKGAGIRLQWSDHNLIEHNLVHHNEHSGIMISISSDLNVINHNTIWENNLEISDNAGIWSNESSWNRFIGNDVHDNHYYGVYMSNVFNYNFENNTISNTLDNETNLYMVNVHHSIFLNNTLWGGTYLGMELENCYNNTFQNLDNQNNDEHTMELYDCGQNRWVNCTFGNSPDGGVDLTNCIDELFINCSFEGCAVNLYLFDSTNITLINSTIGPSTDTGILLDSSIPAPVTELILVNTTFENYTLWNNGCNITVYWYLHVRVLDELGQPMAGALVNATNDDDDLPSRVTNGNGWIKWWVVPEFYNETIFYLDYNPYSIWTSNETHEARADGVQMDQNRVVILQMEPYIAHNINLDQWYGTIQSAIDNAEIGDMIEVIPGTHSENLQVWTEVQIVASAFTLDGRLWINGTGTLTFHNCTVEVGNVMVKNESMLVIDNCPNTIISKSVMVEGLLAMYNSTWEMNCSYDGQYGIQVNDTGRLVVKGNNKTMKWQGHSTVRAHGAFKYFIDVLGDDALHVGNSTIMNCGWDDANPGLNISGNMAYLYNATLTGNHYGIFLYGSEDTLILESTITGNADIGVMMEEALRCNVSWSVINTNVENAHAVSIYGNAMDNIIAHNDIDTWAQGSFGFHIDRFGQATSTAYLRWNDVHTWGESSYGIWSRYVWGLVIENNTFTTSSSNSKGVFLYDGNNARIISNRIFVTTSNALELASTGNADVWNNLISSSSTGVDLWSSTSLAHLKNNTINSGGWGLEISGCSFITVEHCNITAAYGVRVYQNPASSRWHEIKNNTISATWMALDLWGARENLVEYNNITCYNLQTVYVRGDSYGNIIRHNNINSVGTGLNAYGIYLDPSMQNNADILHNVITAETYGIYYASTYGECTIAWNEIYSGTTGIHLMDADNLDVNNNTVESDGIGISLTAVTGPITGAELSGNTIETDGDAAHGIYLGVTAPHTVLGAELYDNNVWVHGTNSHGIMLNGVRGAMVNDNSATTDQAGTYGMYVNSAMASGSQNTLKGDQFDLYVYSDAVYNSTQPENIMNIHVDKGSVLRITAGGAANVQGHWYIERDSKLISVPQVIILTTRILELENSTADLNSMHINNGGQLLVDPSTVYMTDLDAEGIALFESSELYMSGDLVVMDGGDFTLNNSDLTFNLTSDGQFFIDVLANGWMRVLDDSMIGASNVDLNYNWWFRANSHGRLYDSWLLEAGVNISGSGGIQVATYDVEIVNCQISHRGVKGTYGIWKTGNVATLIHGNTFNNLMTGVYLSNGQGTLTENTFQNSNYGIIINTANQNTINDNDFISCWSAGIRVNDPYTQPMYGNYFNGCGHGLDTFGDANFEVVNSTIVNTVNNDFNFGAASHVTALNTTFNPAKVGFSETTATLTVKWYMNLYVTDGADPIVGAVINITNDQGGATFDGLSDGNGRVKWLPCTEYIQKQTLTTQYTPHDIVGGTSTRYGEIIGLSMDQYRKVVLVLDLKPVHNLDQDIWYGQIQLAIDDANPGEHIAVNNATFYETLNIDIPLTISGWDKDTVIIDGGASWAIVWIEANDVEFFGFTIQGTGTGVNDACVYLNQVQNCDVHDLKCLDNGLGVYLQESHNNTISDVTCNNAQHAGLRMFYSDNNLVQDFTCSDLVQIGSRGVELYDANENDFTDCYLSHSYCGLWIGNSTGNVFESCVLDSNNYSAELQEEGHNQIVNSTFVNPVFFDLMLSLDAELTLLNTTHDPSKEILNSGSELIVQWYLSVFATDGGAPLPGVPVRAKDAGLAVEAAAITGPDGWARWLIVTEYDRTDSGRTDHTPHNITCPDIQYEPVWEVRLMDHSQDVFLVLAVRPRVHNLDTGEDFFLIQDAIDDVDTLDGHTILVENATFNENVVLDKALNLEGSGMGRTIIDAGGAGNVLEVIVDGATVSKLGVRNSGIASGNAGLKLSVVVNVHAWKVNASWNLNGIYIWQSGSCIVEDCEAYANQYGARLSASDNNLLMNNTIYSNGYGLYSSFSSGNEIHHNSFISNQDQAYDSGANTWDNGYSSGGNHWSDWTGPDLYNDPTTPQTTGSPDGYVDNAYMIPGGANQDSWPFAEQSGWSLGPQNLHMLPGTATLVWEHGTNVLNYYVFSSEDRFSFTFGTGPGEYRAVLPASATTWTDSPANLSGIDTRYYIVRAWGPGGWSDNSTMGAWHRFEFNWNTVKKNNNWISMPYNSSIATAQELVDSIEGGHGAGANTKLTVIGKWDTSIQGTENYYYSMFPVPGWVGIDFTIDPGDGVNLVLSGNTANFEWIASGTDMPTTQAFTWNDELKNNNWLSIAWSTDLVTASDLVDDIEGGHGAGSNSKLTVVGKWNPVTQGTDNYYYSIFPVPGWTGSNFALDAGDGVNLVLSGNTDEFTWNTGLVSDPKPSRTYLEP